MTVAAVLLLALLANPDDEIARGLKVTSVATDKDGIRTIELKNPKATYTLQCTAAIDSCSLPAMGAKFALKKSSDRIYAGDNVKLTQGNKDVGHFRLIQITSNY